MIPTKIICPLLLTTISFTYAQLPKQIKSIWHYGGDSPVYTKFAEVGLNAGAFQFFPFKNTPTNGINQEELERWRITVKLSKENGIIPFAKIYVFGDWMARYIKGRSYRYVVTETGQRCTLTPCPLERKFWIDILGPVFEAVAQTLKDENSPGGILLENESYAFGTIYPGFWDMRKRYCFCDDCFARFLKLQGIKLKKLPSPSNRARWLDTHGLAWEYEQFMKNEFAKIIAELIQRAKRIHPQFYLAQYPYFPQWFCNGIIEASADDTCPTLLFSHIEYFSGFNKLSDQRIEYLRAKGYNVKYLGGLTIGYYKPELLAKKISELLTHTDGYWLYWGGTLTASDWKNRIPGGKDFKKLSHEYRLLAPPDEYWKWIRLANDNKVQCTPKKQKYIPIKTIIDRTNWLKRQWEYLRGSQVKNHKIHFGPDDDRFRGSWLVQTKISVPDKSWLKLTANVKIEGKQKFVHIGFGKLNWYDWSILAPATKPTTITRIIKLSNAPSLLVNDKTPKKQITIRFHIKPTENKVVLNWLKIELIHPKLNVQLNFIKS